MRHGIADGCSRRASAAGLGSRSHCIALYLKFGRNVWSDRSIYFGREVVKILNFYLEYMADAIAKERGTIDEFMGDGILVLFGAPISRVDDAEGAVACAVAMQQAMIPVNKQMKEWKLRPLEMGIGINTAEVVVGNIGSEKRTKYGIVGSQVNLTYPIESYTTGGQVLISEETFKDAGDIVVIDEQKKVQPKGVKEPICIYDVDGLGGGYDLYLAKDNATGCDRLKEVLICLTWS